MSNNFSLNNVTKTYEHANAMFTVLSNVNATFIKNHTYAITGSSGSGKSTLMHLLAGLDFPSSGSITFDGKNVQALNESEKSNFLNKSIGLVFQSPYLIKELTVLENVLLKGLIGGISHSQCAKKAQELLEGVGLLAKINNYPAQLSGGQQQRVAIARALMNRPDFLLADEPTGNLDMNTGMALVNLLLQLQKEWQMGLIISSHDPFVKQKMEFVYEIKNGLLDKIGN